MVKGILLGAISMAISIVLAHLGVRVAEVRRLRLTASAEHRARGQARLVILASQPHPGVKSGREREDRPLLQTTAD